MRSKSGLLIIFLFFITNLTFGQKELKGFHAESRSKADLVIQKLIESDQFDTSSYALLASNNSYYFIVLDRKTHFSLAWVELKRNDDIELIKVLNKKKPHPIIGSIFKFDNYHKDFISFDSEYFKNGYDVASGAPTYFVVKDSSGTRYGESTLSMIVSPNPIDNKIYVFMVSALINRSN